MTQFQPLPCTSGARFALATSPPTRCVRAPATAAPPLRRRRTGVGRPSPLADPRERGLRPAAANLRLLRREARDPPLGVGTATPAPRERGRGSDDAADLLRAGMPAKGCLLQQVCISPLCIG